jgi:hypothetical protein
MSDHEHDQQAGDEGGQVSEVGSLGEAGEPIADDQAVQGAPDAESGEVEEGAAGPNARTGSGDNAPEAGE